jgi:hypothetical protein
VLRTQRAACDNDVKDGATRLRQARSDEQAKARWILVRCLLLALVFASGCAWMWAVEQLKGILN